MWRETKDMADRGVIVACSKEQEWLLPWWQDNYARHNRFPVTVVDFGLSEEAKAFCAKIGTVIDFPYSSTRVGEKEETNRERGDFWEKTYGSSAWWEKRGFWHKKPMALLQSPYRFSLWLDLDCEILAPLDPLFEQVEKSEALLLCPEPEGAQAFDREKGHIFPDEVLFNSGVIGFQRGVFYIEEWAVKTLSDHGNHLGDQNLLSRLIYEKKWPVQILDPMYNWRRIDGGYFPEVKIVHWVGESGKFWISMKMQGLS